jgi:hypothetical protein
MRRRRRGEQQDNRGDHGDAHARPHRRRCTCVSSSSPEIGALRLCPICTYMGIRPGVTHGEAVGRYMRADACLYLLLACESRSAHAK